MVSDPQGSALTGYESPNAILVDNTPPDLEALAELERLRGSSGRDEEVHKALGLAVRKDKEIHAGIDLEIVDPGGNESNPIRYWETTKDPPIAATADALYGWMAGRLIIRNPTIGQDTTVQVQRKSEGDFIRFTFGRELHQRYGFLTQYLQGGVRRRICDLWDAVALHAAYVVRGVQRTRP
jgi:hypothetical protein